MESNVSCSIGKHVTKNCSLSPKVFHFDSKIHYDFMFYKMTFKAEIA